MAIDDWANIDDLSIRVISDKTRIVVDRHRGALISIDREIDSGHLQVLVAIANRAYRDGFRSGKKAFRDKVKKALRFSV